MLDKAVAYSDETALDTEIMTEAAKARDRQAADNDSGFQMAEGSVLGKGIPPPGLHYAYFGGQGDAVRRDADRRDMDRVDPDQIMQRLTQLTDAHLKLAKGLDRQFNMAVTTLLLKVKAAVTQTSGAARDFMEDLVGAAENFFREAEKYEAKINSLDVMVFAQGPQGICGTI